MKTWETRFLNTHHQKSMDFWRNVWRYFAWNCQHDMHFHLWTEVQWSPRTDVWLPEGISNMVYVCWWGLHSNRHIGAGATTVKGMARIPVKRRCPNRPCLSGLSYAWRPGTLWDQWCPGLMRMLVTGRWEFIEVNGQGSHKLFLVWASKLEIVGVKSEHSNVVFFWIQKPDQIHHNRTGPQVMFVALYPPIKYIYM